ncbi:aspartate aminotransferase [Fusarium sp. NRRL 52700]|nr:aspartate aminotransferase [Fusarium sp. NRRL 52700]
MPSTTASNIQSYLLPTEVLWLGLIVLSVLLSYAWLLYPLLHGRFHHIPGPWYCKISSLPLAFYDISCCRNEVILSWHRKHGPVILIAPNEVSVSDLQGTRDVYKATGRWAKSGYFDHFQGYGMRSVFATKQYEDHRKKRKYTSTFYQPSTIYKVPEIEQHIKARSLAFLNQVQGGQAVDVYSLTSWFAFDNITFLVLGPAYSTCSVDQLCPERGILAGLKSQQFFGPFRHRYPQLYKSVSWILQRLSSSFCYLSADDALALWCQQRFSTVAQDPRLSKSHSLVRHLLEIEDIEADEGPAYLQYIAAEVLDNINAAEATVAVTATYLIWTLTQVPYWQQQIRRELSVLPREDDGKLSFSDVDSQVPSLEACLREVYRLYPASSGRAERIVPHGGRDLSGVFLPQDTIVTSSLLALHYDPQVYPDPSSFSPERWLEGDERSQKLSDKYLMPFGYGGRNFTINNKADKMKYERMAIEKEAPEEVGAVIKYNLSESAIADQTLESLGIVIPSQSILTYTEHKGSHHIRSVVAQASGGTITAEDVLVTAGASTALFIINTALMEPGDHAIVTRPNYATNLEIPRSIGCDITFIDLEFESQFRLETERVAAAIRPGITKLISICSPNNPTGTMCTPAELKRLASLAKENNCYLLIDETYADLVDYTTDDVDPSPRGACLGDHVVTVSSMSKAYGVPGIRVGWLTTTNPILQEMFLAAKEQISISGSVLDELIAEQILSRRDTLLPATIAEMRHRRDFVAEWVHKHNDLVDWVRPDAGVMCFIKIKKQPKGGIEAFYKRLLNNYGVYIGRGTWFERDDCFFRLGYGWPTFEQLKEGLNKISEALTA